MLNFRVTHSGFGKRIGENLWCGMFFIVEFNFLNERVFSMNIVLGYMYVLCNVFFIVFSMKNAKNLVFY